MTSWQSSERSWRLLVRRQGANGGGWKLPSLPLLPSYWSWANRPGSMSYNQHAQRRGLGHIADVECSGPIAGWFPMVVDRQALKCLCICGEVPKCTRRGSWLMCTVLRLKAQFQKWWATYASAIPDDVHVKLVESSTDNAPCVDANDPGARIITFGPFYFSLGFTFPLSKFFREVFCAMECGPSQCTPNVYWVIMCFGPDGVRVLLLLRSETLQENNHSPRNTQVDMRAM
ncbi:unnamed protein product [Prunus armeniaca]